MHSFISALCMDEFFPRVPLRCCICCIGRRLFPSTFRSERVVRHSIVNAAEGVNELTRLCDDDEDDADDDDARW